jgi:hypothetical protein
LAGRPATSKDCTLSPLQPGSATWSATRAVESDALFQCCAFDCLFAKGLFTSL